MRMKDARVEPHVHYDDPAYQHFVEAERNANNGMRSEEVYQREAEFALRAAGLSDPKAFGEGEGICDLASGSSRHAFAMSDLLEGEVPILATDPAVELGKLARQKFDERQSSGVRQKIDFLFDPQRAKLQNLSRESLGGRKTKLITVLGASFGYGNVQETRTALRNVWDVLEPGGSLVLQWRQRPLEKDRTSDEFMERLRMRDEAASRLGACWVEDEQVDGETMHCILSEDGNAYHVGWVDCDHPDPERQEEYAETQSSTTGKREWVHRDTGIRFESFRRILVDCDDHRTELPPTRISNICSEDETVGVNPVTKFLREAGFVGIQLKKPESDADWLGAQRMMAIVARKPSAHELEVERTKEFWGGKP